MFVREEAARFLSALLSEMPEDKFFYLWTLPDKYSLWKHPVDKSVEEALDYAEKKVKANADVYVGVGFSPKKNALTKRLQATQVCGIPGVWADIDIAADVHKKTSLPPNKKEAMKFIEKIGLDPTMIVHSGHGLQAWWLFKEPWMFESESEQLEGIRFAAAWGGTLTTRAYEMGYKIDSTHDLSRVMRLPGTMNLKSAPVQVKLMEESGKRYGLEDIKNILADEQMERFQTINLSAQSKGGSFVLDPAATPPFDKFIILHDNCDSFKKLWDHKRKPANDDSPSGYDMALASLALGAGWTEQETVDLLIKHRTKYGYDLKLREDYYQRTVSNALKSVGVAHERDTGRLIETLTNVQNDENISEEDARDTVFKEISSLLEVDIKDFVKYDASPPSYRIFTNGKKDVRSVHIPSSEHLLSPTLFARLIVNAADHVIPAFKPKVWKNIVQLLLNSARVEDVSEEAQEEGEIIGLVSDYLDSRPPMESPQEGYDSSRPFVFGKDVHLLLSAFRDWASSGKRTTLSQRDICAKLKAYGAENVKVSIRKRASIETEDEIKYTTISAWRIPPRWLK